MKPALVFVLFFGSAASACGQTVITPTLFSFQERLARAQTIVAREEKARMVASENDPAKNRDLRSHNDTNLPDAEQSKTEAALSDGEILSALRTHITADGSTVEQVLEYASKLRPSKFKVQQLEVDRESKRAEVAYWIGMKRLEGDAYTDLSFYYSGRVGGIQIKPFLNPNDRPTWGGPGGTEALESGRDPFLRFVDGQYRETCLPDDAEARTC